MQPSYVYCKICGYYLDAEDFPKEVIGDSEMPIDDESVFATALKYARENIRCPRCKNKKWIRKVYWKV